MYDLIRYECDIVPTITDISSPKGKRKTRIVTRNLHTQKLTYRMRWNDKTIKSGPNEE